MVSLVAMGGVRGAHRARHVARLPYTGVGQRPGLRHTSGGALTGVPSGRRAHSLAAPHQPHRVDLLWCGATLRRGPLHRSVRLLRATREFRVSWWGVHGLVLMVGGVRGASPGGNLRDAAVPRWASTLS